MRAGAGATLRGGSFANTGSLNTAGAFTLTSSGSFSNSGTLDLAPALFTSSSTVFTNSGTVNAIGGATRITANQTLVNSGTINLGDGAADDVLTITNGYSGTGAARLNIDVAGGRADQLVIGGPVGGNTQIFVSGGGTVLPTPVLVVSAAGAAQNAFSLGNSAVTPLIDLVLTQTAQGFFLSAAPNQTAFEPSIIGLAAPDLWFESADAYQGYAADRVADIGRTRGVGIWGQAYVDRARFGGVDNRSAFGTNVSVDNRVREENRGAQLGIDYLPGGSSLLFGVTGGYEAQNDGLRSLVGELRARGYNVGGYVQYGGQSGLYASLLGKRDRSSIRLTNPAFGSIVGKPHVTSSGADAEVGYRVSNAGGVHFDLGAGLAYVRSSFESFAASGISYDLHRVKNVRSRLGARVGFNGALSPFIDAKMYHEFAGDSRLTLASGLAIDQIVSPGRGTWGRITVGLGGHSPLAPLLAAWADVGDVKGIGIRAGLRFGGSREAVPVNTPPSASMPPQAPPPPMIEPVVPSPPPAPPAPPSSGGQRGR